MKINKTFLPMKGHFFFFFGCLSPILPFMMVLARQLGIPVVVQGTLGSLILIITLIIKPLIAALADAFSSSRKAIFVLVLTLMVSSFFTICFLPPMHGLQTNEISGKIVSHDALNQSNLNATFNGTDSETIFLISMFEGSCYHQELWDCISFCESSGTLSVSRILLDEDTKVSESDYNASSVNEFQRIYHLENDNLSSMCGNRVNFSCQGGLYEGESCRAIWASPPFYAYVILLTIGYVTFATGTSVSDAICLDLIGQDGNYGRQRLWGTLGWGSMGLLGGFLVDWYSGDNFGKNYLPAFLILFVLGSIDVLLSAAKLQVPRFEDNAEVWKSIRVVLKKPAFVGFLLFVVLAGMFDGTTATFIFVFQEEIAKGSAYMRHMKFIQGLTLGIQSFTEVPFMWIGGWVLKKIGSSAVMSLLFFLYSVRMLSMALVGSFGPVWATLIVEILHGPCFGLGYTAIVVQAGLMSPVGTSNTVQSITSIFFECLGYSLASFVGGILFTVLGAPGLFYFFGSMSLLTFCLHVLLITCRGIARGTKEKSAKREAAASNISRGEPLLGTSQPQNENVAPHQSISHQVES